MKKALTLLLTVVLCLTVCVNFTSCGKTTDSDNGNEETKAEATPEPTPVPEDIDPSTVDVITDVWVATEIAFNSTKEYDESGNEQMDVILDVDFKNTATGTTLTIPSFWNGGNEFAVRFAPTEYGVWEYTTKCEQDETLNGLTGKIGANAYKGDLDIYKHGFVTIQDGNKYFTYADGTPFFYLGDTHWSMYSEEYDKAGSRAGELQTDSHFKYIVDKRIEQGFTVYQSEPISSPFGLSDGKIGKNDIKGFKTADLYYQYIAQKGLVHANAEFFFASEMSEKLMNNEAALEKMSRYWVARFGAYPVMWTIAQEIDNDFYAERGDHKFYDYTNNPWLKVAEFIHKYDAYKHPLSGHQENTGATTVTGKGVNLNTASGLGMSIFRSEFVSNQTGHNWWAAQWSPSLKKNASAAVAHDYWDSPKVSVNYESRYCGLWTKNTGERIQGWVSYLSGFFGYGYGAIDIWYYKSTYNIDKDSDDGLETITKEEKQEVAWPEAVEFESAYQVGYMRKFFNTISWWKLVPEFNEQTKFVPTNEEVVSCCATDANNTYVVYFYNLNSTATGKLIDMDASAEYVAKWFNPRTNEYTEIGEIKAEADGSYAIPEKADVNDWVLLVTKK